MYRIDLPTFEGYLLLSPPFGSLPRLGQVIGLAVLLAILLYLIIRLYRYELRFITRSWATTLLSLRMLIVAIILFVVGLKPTMRYISKETIPSHVLIAIDRSESMDITDPQRDPIEKLEVARGLKLATDLADDATLSRWITQLRALSPPTDDAYFEVLKRIDALPRKSLARGVLMPEGINLVNALGQRHKLEIVGFQQQIGVLPDSPDSLRSILLSEGKSRRESYTDLKLPLNRGKELREEYKEGLVGVIILSDGQHNWGGAPGELAYQLGHAPGKPSVPVHTIVCGARMPPPDLAIASLKATPPIVFKHGTVNLDLRLQANNVPAGTIKMTVTFPEAPELPDRKPIVETIEYDGVNQPPPRSIPVKMERAAMERLTVTIEIVPKNGGPFEDRFPENNSRQVVV
ncbi:MAG: hypothetical protein K8T89_14935, partial [Planctomycetes bacterium]|nr:hypothetical protein [Planctomycetota bacterium]